jgi:hypothetical protein
MSLCPCVFGPQQNIANILTVICSVFQIFVFMYAIYNIRILSDEPNNYKKIAKGVMGIMIVVSLALGYNAIRNLMTGNDENNALRKAFCSGEKLEKKSDDECKSLSSKQSVLNWINFFSNIITIVLSIGLVIYYNEIYKWKNPVVGAATNPLFGPSPKTARATAFGFYTCEKGLNNEKFMVYSSIIVSLLSVGSFASTYQAVKENNKIN